MTDLPARGGMCANPFGGEERIDKIPFEAYLRPGSPPETLVFIKVIADAASNYLYFGLGKNGTTIEEFFYSHSYFFKVSSTNKETYELARNIRNVYTRRGEHVIDKRELSDNELQLMCFDKHFDMSGLDKAMNIETFRKNLLKKRAQILTNNWQQVKGYITQLYQRELERILPGKQVPLPVWSDNMLEILTNPSSPAILAQLFYVPAKLKKSHKRSNRKNTKKSSSDLVNNIRINKIPALIEDWGPIAGIVNG